MFVNKRHRAQLNSSKAETIACFDTSNHSVTNDEVRLRAHRTLKRVFPIFLVMIQMIFAAISASNVMTAEEKLALEEHMKNMPVQNREPFKMYLADGKISTHFLKSIMEDQPYVSLHEEQQLETSKNSVIMPRPRWHEQITLKLNDKVTFKKKKAGEKRKTGTIKYIGHVKGLDNSLEYIGICLDEGCKTLGIGNGTRSGKLYLSCDEKQDVFLAVNQRLQHLITRQYQGLTYSSSRARSRTRSTARSRTRSTPRTSPASSTRGRSLSRRSESPRQRRSEPPSRWGSSPDSLPPTPRALERPRSKGNSAFGKLVDKAMADTDDLLAEIEERLRERRKALTSKGS